EDFNDNWWPVVSNFWTQWGSYKQVNGDIRKVFTCHFTKHSESSSREKENIPNEKRRVTKTRPSGLCYAKIESDRIKRSKVIRDLVKNEAVKNYPPPAITLAVKEYAANKLGLGSSVCELTRKEVTNIKYKVRGPMEAHLIGNSNLKLDISESISYLIEKGYLVERYSVSQRSTKGIVFVHPYQLKKLERHGWLTLIDSTHKTNRYDWRLFTLYIRDTYGCWNVGAHFFVSSEDSDMVAEALLIVRKKCCRWSPRYMLLDQSSIEAKSIKKTFPGITASEQECQIIFCIVHVMRTWMQRIYEKEIHDIMIVAMHKRTKVGCENFVQDAISRCSVPAIKNYIKRNYMNNTQQWGLWARQHSPLLLQVTSTNPLESFHSELKKITSSLHGLIASAYGVDNDIMEEIHKFPFPFQNLLIREACSVINRLEKGKGTPGLTSLDCHCLFYNRYLLPCKHIFHENMYGNKLLTAEVWKRFQEMFEESGFEVYESQGSFVEYVQTEQQKGAENRRVSVVELTERIRDRYWHVEESGDVGR
ncbi:8940_t:CDS:2, partial [Cetraspora pellucida]